MIRNAFRAPGTAGASALAVLALAAALIAAPAASAAGREPAPLFAPPGAGAVCAFYFGDEPTFYGDQGDRASEVQCLLANRRYLPWSEVDGTFGPTTLAAVQRFQADHPPLIPSGLVGPRTWSALWKA
ncbi:peptidoglycan-binding protein [Streptomyces sp. NBC_00121]|uniref:peptidoglycan-binding domain-containing protein n=1 Tax=unclassified Streptomyces TaxID=2593676 RepID=UPI0028C38A18|nr:MULTISPECIES: peptidoglycan-binding protein [unclassified Streptomyces]WNO64945.1 peptidoglycan-binding protein [Streptomyces sp. AM2-3-1]WSC69532.1 peptidoglycan-binding protein [Streptomyces sp. NBC_01760]WTE60011.1 peptidoglycan-binding protein [Streptomyces sp. NBC_01617]WTI87412.1 peptidoglycan-binding protein [Streptomyces sp. NBC_00724]